MKEPEVVTVKFRLSRNKELIEGELSINVYERDGQTPHDIRLEARDACRILFEEEYGDQLNYLFFL